MDQHFQQAPAKENMPLILGLLDAGAPLVTGRMTKLDMGHQPPDALDTHMISFVS